MVKKASGRARSDLGDLRPQDGGHALPGLVGAGDIIAGAALVGKSVRGIVAIDLVLDTSSFRPKRRSRLTQASHDALATIAPLRLSLSRL